MHIFVFNCKFYVNNKNSRRIDSLSIAELDESKLFWLRRAQVQDFEPKINSLLQEKDIYRRSCLKSFNPYLDDHKLIRVGGRLVYAPTIEHKKYPIVFSSKNRITKIIFQY